MSSVTITPVSELHDVSEVERLGRSTDVSVSEFNSTVEVEVERTEELHVELVFTLRGECLHVAFSTYRGNVTYASREGLKRLELLVTGVVQENLRGGVVEQFDRTFLIVRDLSDHYIVGKKFKTILAHRESVLLTIVSGNHSFLRRYKAPAGVYRTEDSR